MAHYRTRYFILHTKTHILARCIIYAINTGAFCCDVTIIIKIMINVIVFNQIEVIAVKYIIKIYIRCSYLQRTHTTTFSFI